MIDQVRNIYVNQLKVYSQKKQEIIIENIFKRIIFNDKYSENKKIKKKQTNYSNFILKTFTIS